MDVERSHADSRRWAGNPGAKILKDERKKLISGIISERLNFGLFVSIQQMLAVNNQMAVMRGCCCWMA